MRVSRERQAFLATAPMRRRWKSELASGVVTWIPATIALVLVVLGALPQQDAALYFLAAVLLLLMAALLLLSAVFRVGFSAYVAAGGGEGPDRSAARGRRSRDGERLAECRPALDDRSRLPTVSLV